MDGEFTGKAVLFKAGSAKSYSSEDKDISKVLRFNWRNCLLSGLCYSYRRRKSEFSTWALVIGDLSAGVGAVAIPASRKVRRIYANEVKREAHTFLTINVGNNRASGKVEVSIYVKKYGFPVLELLVMYCPYFVS